MAKFTAFCREASNTGTTWIDEVEADSVDDAIGVAVAQCADDWGYSPMQVVCIGISNAETRILFWDDLE